GYCGAISCATATMGIANALAATRVATSARRTLVLAMRPLIGICSSSSQCRLHERGKVALRLAAGRCVGVDHVTGGVAVGADSRSKRGVGSRDRLVVRRA